MNTSCAWVVWALLGLAAGASLVRAWNFAAALAFIAAAGLVAGAWLL